MYQNIDECQYIEGDCAEICRKIFAPRALRPQFFGTRGRCGLRGSRFVGVRGASRNGWLASAELEAVALGDLVRAVLLLEPTEANEARDGLIDSLA